MRKAFKHGLAALLLVFSLFTVASVASADAALDFEVTSVSYEDGVLSATGQFTNTGDKSIVKVNKVDVKIFLYNDDGDSVEAANHYFTDLALDIDPGESVEYTLQFPDVPEYVDATKWSAEEGEWEFTYAEDDAADEATAEDDDAATAADDEDDAADEGEASLDFEVTSVSYVDGTLTAQGTFTNTGAKAIETVNSVNVKITLYNDAGDSEEVADHVFKDLAVHLKSGESIEYTLEFTGVPEYEDATKWSAEEVDWEFTYFE
jgi:hypothetical protein